MVKLRHIELVLTPRQHNAIVVLIIPTFDPASGNLPPGVHEATWDEFVERFGSNRHRRALLAALEAALISLRSAGCRRAYIGEDFMTAKELPADFDACWEAAEVGPNLLESVLLDYSDCRAAQKAKYGGEFFLADLEADPHGRRFFEFFQIDGDTGDPKGIVALDLGGLP